MTNSRADLTKAIAEGTTSSTLRTRSQIDHDTRAQLPTFVRYVIIETISDPQAITPEDVSRYRHEFGVSNMQFVSVLPRNTVIARKVLRGPDVVDTPPMFMFPFFPSSLALPCKPGEHVWVMFENPGTETSDIGYWVCRITEPGFVDDVNHTHPPRVTDPSFFPTARDRFDGNTDAVYEYRNGMPEPRGPSAGPNERYTVTETASLNGPPDAYQNIIETSNEPIESVPRFKKRPGDTAFEGSNNTLIVLGRDRTGRIVDVQFEKSAGAIDLVVGRGQTQRTGGTPVQVKRLDGTDMDAEELAKHASAVEPDEGDPDFIRDKSRLYIAQRTSVDTALDLSEFNSQFGNGQVQGKSLRDAPEDNRLSDVDENGNAHPDGALAIKTDKVRIIARSDIELIVTGIESRNADGTINENFDLSGFAAIVLKANGDVVFRPSRMGYVKLGGDDANRGIVCSDEPVTAVNGGIVGAPLITTMGGQIAGSKDATPEGNSGALSAGQATYANKVLVK